MLHNVVPWQILHQLASEILMTTSKLKAFNRVRMLHNVVPWQILHLQMAKSLTLCLPLAQRMKVTGTTLNGPLNTMSAATILPSGARH